jgi:hypothetical protein
MVGVGRQVDGLNTPKTGRWGTTATGRVGEGGDAAVAWACVLVRAGLEGVAQLLVALPSEASACQCCPLRLLLA